MNLSSVVGLIGNLIPLAGILYWQWDPFQLLMLYWMETVIVAGFALARLRGVPKSLLGTIRINGFERQASHHDLIELFGGMATAFICVHFLFLWLLFSGDWTKTVRGPVSFVQVFVIESGAWVALLFAFLAGAVGLFTSPARPQIARDLQARFPGRRLVEDTPEPDEGMHGVGAAVGGLLDRIAVMQVAVIAGAMLAKTYGTQAPLLIVIGLKTLFDLRIRPLTGVTLTSETRVAGRAAQPRPFRLPD